MDSKIVDVLYHKQICEGEASTWCMLVKQNGQKDYEYFYENIEGFTYEWGYNYKLQLTESKVANAPQDASSIRYKLLKVIKKEKLPAGTKFNIALKGVSVQMHKNGRHITVLNQNFLVGKTVNTQSIAKANLLHLRINEAGGIELSSVN